MKINISKFAFIMALGLTACGGGGDDSNVEEVVDPVVEDMKPADWSWEEWWASLTPCQQTCFTDYCWCVFYYGPYCVEEHDQCYAACS